MSCNRSAAPCSSAAERATYCRVPFRARVCQISPGVVSSPSALVSQQSLLYRGSVFFKHTLRQKVWHRRWHTVLFDPLHPPMFFFLFIETFAPPLWCSSFLCGTFCDPTTYQQLPTLAFCRALFNLPPSPSLLLSSSSPPLQPARATSPVWCASHWTAVPWLHAHLYVSAWLLFGWRIRAQDLPVWWKLDGEAPSVCRYHPGCIPPKWEHVNGFPPLQLVRHDSCGFDDSSV